MPGENNAVRQQPEKVKITSKDFAAKYRSKREVYNFLAVDVGVYLPSYGKFNAASILTPSSFVYRAVHHLFPQGPHVQQEEE